ncbi:MAG: NAD(P)/FAD-dependent oxidoreductase [Eggerthellaceae bacterium]|jgi:electron transfer flavoprotein-quinone oxidoreductase|nr:NAD(P)/FAD-dependent oxidoreductase [Eggerthellaceae bacterium]MDR2715616.1 NAD(P)/FAD-dependent oxidoreductase [Coriobacteriaceae bacterium]
MAEKYDVVIVGAGPSGTLAAKHAAQGGCKVVMLERAAIPGQKNMSGSYFFKTWMEECWPGFVDQDFLDGHIKLGGVQFAWTPDNDYKFYGMIVQPGAETMYEMQTVFRNETDPWVAEQAVKAGAELVCATVSDAIWDGDRVVGVKTDKGDFMAPIVMDCSGLHAILGKRTGLTNWGPDKVMLGLKYIFKGDPDELRRLMNTYFDDEGNEVDYGAFPIFAGNRPEFWGAHCVCEPGRDGTINLIIYQCLAEMIANKTNIHQRAQWMLNMPPYKNILDASDFVYCNFHCLASGDLVGYTKKSYMKGLMIMGDAGGFAQPLDNFGANCAQAQGIIAGKLAAEMTKAKDFSEEKFAEFEERWKETWLPEDNVPEVNRVMREGSIDVVIDCMDEAMNLFFQKKFENYSYPAIIGSMLPKFLPVMGEVPVIAGAMTGILRTGVKKATDMMALLASDD